MQEVATQPKVEMKDKALEMTSDGMPKRYQRRNFILFSVWAGVFALGWAMPNIVRAPYLNWLQVSERTIGTIGSFSFMSLFGLVFAPSISRRFVRKKWLQFFMSMPYFLSDLSVGICILIAMAIGPGPWLVYFSVVCFASWPFMAGWGNIPYQEYTANCISKDNIGAFVGVSQIIGPLMGLLGSAVMTGLLFYFDVPLRYAIAFVVAYLFAQFAISLSLFAHEAPVPQPPKAPFWHPMVNAVKDPTFRKLLYVVGAGTIIMFFPFQFIAFLAIREWTMPDWIAGVFATVVMGANTVGAGSAAWIGKKKGFRVSLVSGVAFITASMIMLSIPRFSSAPANWFHPDVWRFILVAVLYGTGYTAITVSGQSLMYILAPQDRRAGCFSAYGIVQTVIPGIAVFISGFSFIKGYYQFAFAGVAVAAAVLALYLVCGKRF